MKKVHYIVILFIFVFTFNLLKAESGQELYRPAFHFSPRINWLNDPNGLVFYDGEYHLFYQYNPYGIDWGNMSWGHAVSTDLFHWEELQIAIPVINGVAAFSGSAVIDWDNTSEFGSGGNPPMIAIYTGADGNQHQNIAFSFDKGRTWQFYSGNPVLNLFDDDFRDPKVFWHKETNHWIMVVALSARHRVRLYRSPDLKNWEFLQDFGNVGDQSGVWECPDLFPLAVDDDPNNIKWVLQVDVGPGIPQYFIGDFDGYRLTIDKFPEETIDQLPEGVLIADFDGDNWGDWLVTGTAFGEGPVNGSLPDQLPVSGFLGEGFVNSYHGGDISTGTLTSPSFTITNKYINLKVGGGNHPDHVFIQLLVNGETIYSETGRDDEFLVWNAWDVEDLIGHQATIQIVDNATEGWGHINIDHIFMSDISMTQGPTPSGDIIDDFEGQTYDGWTVIGEAFGNGPAQGTLPGQQEVTGFLGRGLVNSFLGGDSSQGKMTSPEFLVDSTYISFLIGGGNHPDGTFIRLLVNGNEVRKSTGNNSERLIWKYWDVEEYIGVNAVIEIVDSVTGGWGHINIDHIIQTGNPPENDEIDLVDFGKDFYAAQSWSDIPEEDGRRIWLAWMNNWSYAGQVPTYPWRGIMSIPREVKLTNHHDKIVLTQNPVKEIEDLRESLTSFENIFLSELKHDFDQIEKSVFELKATIDIHDANQVGFRFRMNSNQFTEIVYDAIQQQVYFDRSNSGALTHNNDFSELQSAPLVPDENKIKIHVLVDNSSIELFFNDGKVVFTNQIFPDSTSNGMEIFGMGGDAFIEKLEIWGLKNTNPPLSTGDLNPILKEKIRIFPNPLKKSDLTLIIDDSMTDQIHVDIYHVSGTKISSLKAQGSNGKFKIPQSHFLNSGLYLLAIHVENKIVVKKINIVK